MPPPRLTTNVDIYTIPPNKVLTLELGILRHLSRGPFVFEHGKLTAAMQSWDRLDRRINHVLIVPSREMGQHFGLHWLHDL